MFTTSNVLRAKNCLNSISTGERQRLGKGDSVTYNDLPNQPIALTAFNNTGTTTKYIVQYNNEPPKSFTIDSVQSQGFSLGSAVLLNPAVTGSREISVSVPNDVPEKASIDVYLVSLYLPTESIQNYEIPLNGSSVQFNGYSRAYATPPLAWYNLQIQSQQTGLIGFIFNQNTIDIVGVNVNDQIIPVIKGKVYCDSKKTGIALADSNYIFRSGNTYQEDIYGTSTQIVYSPVSSANTTKNGTISIQKM